MEAVELDQATARDQRGHEGGGERVHVGDRQRGQNALLPEPEGAKSAKTQVEPANPGEVVVRKNAAFGHSGRSRGDPCRRALRPTDASKAAVWYVRNTSIVLKNSNFRIDHNSEDRWRPR